MWRRKRARIWNRWTLATRRFIATIRFMPHGIFAGAALRASMHQPNPYKMRNGAPKLFLAPRQSVSSRPNTFSRHDKVFRPAQSLSHATAKCFVLPNRFLAPRQSVSFCPNTFSCHDKVFGPVLSAKLGSLGIFANSLRPPPVATAQRTKKNCDGLRQTRASELLYLMREK